MRDSEPIHAAAVHHDDLAHPGAVRFLPDDPRAALEVRLLDRVFDLHVMGAAQVAVDEALRAAALLETA